MFFSWSTERNENLCFMHVEEGAHQASFAGRKKFQQWLSEVLHSAKFRNIRSANVRSNYDGSER